MKRAAFLIAIVLLFGCERAPVKAPVRDASKQAPPPVAIDYKVVEVADAGRVEGRVAWKGDAPTDPLALPEAPSHCNPNPKPGTVPARRLTIGPGGGIKDAVVWLEGLKAGKPFPEGKPLLENKDHQMQPHVMLLPLPRTLTLVNRDDELHTVEMHGAETASIALPIKGQEIAWKASRPGPVELSCGAGHTGMSGYIFVTPHPYYAVTDAEGRFALDGVPPGTYKLVAWHEGWRVDRIEQRDGLVSGYFYSKPIVQEREVTVGRGATAAAEFALTQQGAQ